MFLLLDEAIPLGDNKLGGNLQEGVLNSFLEVVSMERAQKCSTKQTSLQFREREVSGKLV